MSIYTGVLERAAQSVTFASAGVFAGLSRLRGKRFFHPDGVACEATIAFLPTSFDLPFSGDTSALVRLSRGIGVPGSLPDVFGLAVKLPEPEHDFLFATSGASPVARHLLFPASGAFRFPYSTVLPFELDQRLVVFGARPHPATGTSGARSISQIAELVASQGARFELSVVAVGSKRWEVFASLMIERLYHGDISFNPWNCRAPLVPAGPLNRLRLETYEASQASRAEVQEKPHDA